MKSSHVVVVVAALAAAGCSGPSHMTRAYGVAFREHFARQAANPAAQEPAEKGLDSEEAGIVANAYRQSLAPKGTRETDQPEILLVAPPPRGGGRPTPLAPSVPKD